MKSFTIIGDQEAPVYISTVCSPNYIDVTSFGEYVTCFVTVTDNVAVSPYSVQVVLSSPNRESTVQFNCYLNLGNSYEGSQYFSAGIEPGNWTVTYVIAYDNSGNMLARNVTDGIVVLSVDSLYDRYPPQLQTVTFSPTC